MVTTENLYKTRNQGLFKTSDIDPALLQITIPDIDIVALSEQGSNPCFNQEINYLLKKLKLTKFHVPALPLWSF